MFTENRIYFAQEPETHGHKNGELDSQLAFYLNLYRTVIGPIGFLPGR